MVVGTSVLGCISNLLCIKRTLQSFRSIIFRKLGRISDEQCWFLCCYLFIPPVLLKAIRHGHFIVEDCRLVDINFYSGLAV